MSDSSGSDFEEFLEDSFDVDVGERPYDMFMYSLMEIMKKRALRKNTVISVLFTIDMKFFLHFTAY